ncbi:MAG: sigma-70 family RNA polymerase sigma factor [Luteimonas sp.]
MGAIGTDINSKVQVLYRQHHGWLETWLRRRLGSSAQAADLAQDVFVRLLSRPQLEQLRAPRAYLSTIAHGLMVNHLRRQAIERAYLDVLASRPDLHAPSPEDVRLAMEALEDIARMLDGLPSRVRRIFLLSQMDGWTYPRIAGHLGLTVNVVQKAMVRAMAACYRIVYA